MRERTRVCFTESIQTQIVAAEALPDTIPRAAMMLVQSLLNGNKILCCGNGTSAANAQHFAAGMINRFETERPSLPVIALDTDNAILAAIASDRLYNEVYAKQVRALGHAGDVLLTTSTRGNSRDIVKVVEAAVTRDTTIVALTGYDGGELTGLLGSQGVEIHIPSYRSAHIQEMHMLTANCLCGLIGNTLFPHQNSQGEYTETLSPIAVLISVLLLQSCVVAAIVGTAAVGTRAITDPRSVDTQVDDGTLEVRVSSALSKNERIKKEARTNVTAYQGEALLVGQSPNAEPSIHAKQIAMGVDGANEVYNEIRQGQPIGLGEASNDTWITTKVRSQLLTSDPVKSFNVKVIIENGEASLMGLVIEREVKATADIASRVSDVKRVTTAFTFIKQ